MSQAATGGPVPQRQPSPLALYRFHFLGPLGARFDGPSIAPPPHRTQGSLAALLLRPQPQRRERLAGLLSPDTSCRDGRQRLSHDLWLLRRALSDLPLETSSREVYLPPEGRWLDVEAFRQASRREDLQEWPAALALFEGDLLEGVYDEWLLQDREALYLRYVRFSHRACSELRRRGRFE